jgi:uncharacterized protein
VNSVQQEVGSVRIGVLGASGVIGGCVVAEARRRGHAVTAFSRDPAAVDAPPDPGVAWRALDPLDPADLARELAGVDVVVNAVSPGRTPAEAIRSADVLPRVADALLEALEERPAVRAVVVGGAGSLEVAPGRRVMDLPGFAESLPDELGVPPEYLAVVRAHRDALHRYRLSDRLWTYLSPSAGLVGRGERTGRFRTGGDQLLTAADGSSGISAEDLAVAVVDEVEVPRHVQRRFTVGY